MRGKGKRVQASPGDMRPYFKPSHLKKFIADNPSSSLEWVLYALCTFPFLFCFRLPVSIMYDMFTCYIFLFIYFFVILRIGPQAFNMLGKSYTIELYRWPFSVCLKQEAYSRIYSSRGWLLEPVFQNSDLPITCCVASKRLFNLSVPKCHHL